MADRHYGAERRLSTETKNAFKTTEFWAMLALVVGVLVSAAAIKGGDSGTDEFIARNAWLYVSILGGSYFIGRGLAKSGSREPYFDEGTNAGRTEGVHGGDVTIESRDRVGNSR